MSETKRTYDTLHMGRSSIDLYSNDIGAPFVDITSFAAYVGGSPTNISVGGRRLGLKTALLTGLGEDPVGDFILKFLQEGNPIEARIVKDKEEWNKIWSSRAEAGNYLYRLGSTFGSEITVRVDKLRDAFLEAKDFEDAIRKAISLGGDSDTIACIAGGIAQAYYQDIPREIISNVRKRLPEEFLFIIDEFNTKYG